MISILSDIKNRTSHSIRFLLNEEVNPTLSVAGIHLRKLLAPLLRLVYATQTDYKIVIDSRVLLPRTKKGRIFAINHRQADDIVIGANAVGRSAYIVFGNPYLALETTNGLGLWTYGMILLQRDQSSSRKAAYKKMKFVLEHGGNVIIYPEGYWNLDDNGESDERHLADGHCSDSWLIQDINVGILRLAKETGCEIVPTVLHYDELGNKTCYAARGKPFMVYESDDVFEKKNELVSLMQTMYWSLMEKYSTYYRDELESNGVSLYQQWAELKEQLRAACDIPSIVYRLDLADEKRIGKAKVLYGVETRASAFEHLNSLAPTKQNAFLFNKRLK